MFPKYKKVGWWIFSEEVPDGWEDRGETQPYTIVEKGVEKDRSLIKICSTCKSTIRVGREQDQSFLYCPLCLEKRK